MTVYADLLRYRELFANLFRRDFQAKYKGSLLGDPLVAPQSARSARRLPGRLRADLPEQARSRTIRSTCSPDFPAGSSSPSRCSPRRGRWSTARELIKKVRFPRQLVAFSMVATQAVTFALMLAILIVLSLVFVPDARSTVWVAIPLAIVFAAFVAGLVAARRLPQRALPRRRARAHRGAAALVLPHADPLERLDAAGQGEESRHPARGAPVGQSRSHRRSTRCATRSGPGTCRASADVIYLLVAAVVALGARRVRVHARRRPNRRRALGASPRPGARFVRRRPTARSSGAANAGRPATSASRSQLDPREHRRAEERGAESGNRARARAHTLASARGRRSPSQAIAPATTA